MLWSTCRSHPVKGPQQCERSRSCTLSPSPLLSSKARAQLRRLALERHSRPRRTRKSGREGGRSLYSDRDGGSGKKSSAVEAGTNEREERSKHRNKRKEGNGGGERED